jgi:hypothetical protein
VAVQCNPYDVIAGLLESSLRFLFQTATHDLV